MPEDRVETVVAAMDADESAEVRSGLDKRGVQFLAAPVSGNPKCVRSGKFSCVVSGPRTAFDQVKPLLTAIAPRGAAYAGEGELARMCKIAVNLLLGCLRATVLVCCGLGVAYFSSIPAANLLAGYSLGAADLLRAIANYITERDR